MDLKTFTINSGPIRAIRIHPLDLRHHPSVFLPKLSVNYCIISTSLLTAATLNRANFQQNTDMFINCTEWYTRLFRNLRGGTTFMSFYELQRRFLRGI